MPAFFLGFICFIPLLGTKGALRSLIVALFFFFLSSSNSQNDVSKRLSGLNPELLTPGTEPVCPSPHKLEEETRVALSGNLP